MAFVAYYRVSTKGQGESGLGLEAQRAIVQHFAKGADIVLGLTEVASGSSLERRPLLEEALSLCEKEGHSLIVAKMDRLSRNVDHARAILERLGEGRLVCCDLPNTDKFTLTMYTAFAERERELISIRTKVALEARKERGLSNGREKGADTSRAISASAVVRGVAADSFAGKHIAFVTDCRRAGDSWEKIAQKMNRYGWKTTRGYEWKPSSVQRIAARA